MQMTSVELKKHKTALPGESSGCLDRREALGLGKLDIQNQTVELENSNGVRVSSLVKDGNLTTDYYEGVETLYDGFQRGLNISKTAPCLGWRPKPGEPYKWLSYEQVYARARLFGSGLIKNGFPPGQETFVGVYSSNRVGWVLAEQAANMFSMVLVPLYDTLGPDACKYICNQVELKFVICDNEKRAAVLLEQVDEIPSLKTFIIMETFSDEFKEKCAEKGIALYRFCDIEKDAENDMLDPVPPKKDDLCTICYTSGTTGNPKGAMLSHGNFMTCAGGQLGVISDVFEVRTGDCYISYLPLAHVYERFAQLNIFMHGARIGFYQGDPKLLLDDLQALRPTFFPCVPRVMTRIYSRVNANVSQKGRVFKRIFDTAIKAKKKEIQKGIIRNNGPWDALLKKARMLTGGNVRIMTTGAAPISPEIKLFFKALFGCVVVEGYGQTESSTLTSITNPRDLSDGHVGCIISCIQVKLVDVPDLQYFASNGQGEVCIKGGSVFKGYYKDEEKTKEAIDEDGYLHSGDVGQFLPNGQLKIVDRVKHIFKLSQGEYVAPEKIENEYVRTEGVAQIFVHGDSLQDCCVGIVVLDEDWLKALAAKKGWEGESKDWCEMQELNDLVFGMLNQTAKLAQLKGFEQVKIIHINHEAFSVENGLLTPTFKSKRPVVRTRFQDLLDGLYVKLAERKKQGGEKTATAANQNGSASAAAAANVEEVNGNAKKEDDPAVEGEENAKEVKDEEKDTVQEEDKDEAKAEGEEEEGNEVGGEEAQGEAGNEENEGDKTKEEEEPENKEEKVEKRKSKRVKRKKVQQ
ncbi:hypothetical protein BSL78_23893 [Apostichopus japonicus]|uniref:Long-chain-fatty-acid--CoA ligase n=1 Tax=Stichopus japonicus TaxID=307972 RepID=A0A2G8JU76_STIJA|nr:hypothetical protein BSL78_23893 [Apostichopus japonicus]